MANFMRFDGNARRYAKKSRYPVNMLQMSYTDTTDYVGEREPVGYGDGQSHEDGYNGATATNTDEKKPMKRKRSTGYEFG